MNTPEPLRAVGVSYSVEQTTLIESVDLDAAAGQMVGIIGPNGSGKSTFLRLLYRALSTKVGAVRIGDDDLWALPPHEAARRLAAVPQESVPENEIRVLDMVLIGRVPHRRGFEADTRDDLRIARSALATVGLDGFEGRKLRTLSGGERQRVLVARALAQQTHVIVLDEPTNHLDLHYQHELLALLRDLPVTVVIVLHDVNLAAEYCDHLVVLDRGRVVRSGSVDAVLTEQLLAEVFRVAAHPVTHPVTGRIHLLISSHPPTPRSTS